MTPHQNTPGQSAKNEDWLEIVRDHVNSLRFGTVEIVVHESRVVQIQKTERIRVEKQPDPKSERTG